MIVVLLAVCFTIPANAQVKREQPTKTVDHDPYEKWVDEDVRWIITPEEREAFRRLHTDEERHHFVEQFWLRRDPTPGTPENKYKEEHYRRLAYANMHFASGIPGWKTDRGRIYILYGPPDAIKQSAGADGGSAHAGQSWLYKVLPGVGKDVQFRFVDTCDCGQFQLQPA